MTEQPKDRLDLLIAAVREFADERDWQQFHNAKNLTMALAGEVGELLAELQWVEPQNLDQALRAGSPSRDRFENELADVFIYLLRLADVTAVDLVAAAKTKLASNRNRYPAHLAYGSASKHDRLHDETD